jgi:hypothetical protein
VLLVAPMPFTVGRFVETRHLNPAGAVYENARWPKFQYTLLL